MNENSTSSEEGYDTRPNPAQVEPTGRYDQFDIDALEFGALAIDYGEDGTLREILVQIPAPVKDHIRCADIVEHEDGYRAVYAIDITPEEHREDETNGDSSGTEE